MLQPNNGVRPGFKPAADLKTRFVFHLAVLIALLHLFSPASAEIPIPSAPSHRVNDFARLLSPDQFQTIESYLSQYEQATSNQMVVVILPSLEGESIEDYSIRLAQRWKIGKKGKDNGVLFLVALRDHRMRIEVGYGLEGKLTDIAAGEIIRDKIAPFFRQNRVAEGIEAGIVAITEKIDGQPFHPQLLPIGSSQGSKGLPGFPVMVVALLIIVFVLFRIFGAFAPLVLLSSGIGRGGSWGNDSSSGDSFSGGGGSFGGGGASGSW